MKKIIQILLFLLFSSYSLYAQVNVQSTKVNLEVTEIAKLNNLFEEYEVIKIDLPSFKRSITSLKESRVL
jgi:serine protease inhibitor